MNEFFDIVENFLRSGDAEQAFALLQQVNDSSDRYVQLTNQCRQMLENQYMTQIQQGLGNGDKAGAQAAIDQFRAKFGSNPTIDALASAVAAIAAPAMAAPTPQPQPAQPAPVPPTPQPTAAPAPKPVAPPTPQPAPQPTPAPQPAAPQPAAPQPAQAPQFAPIPEPQPMGMQQEPSPMYGAQPMYGSDAAKTAKKSKKGLWIWLTIIILLLGGAACSYFFIDPVKKFVNNTFGIASDSTAVADSTAVESDDEYEDELDELDEINDELDELNDEIDELDDEWDEVDEPSPEDFPGGLADDGLGPDEDQYGNPKPQPQPKPQPKPQPQPVQAQQPTPAPQTGAAPAGEPTGTELRTMLNYIQNNTRSVGVSGTVNVSFVVEANGTTSNVRVTRGLTQAANAEAMRVIQSMRIGNARGVRYSYSAPVKF